MLTLEQFEDKLQESVTAQRLGINNEIPEEYGDRIIELYRSYTDISNLFILGLSYKIYIISGYRCAELNNAVGGVSGSKHCQCKAFDFAFSSVTSKSDFMRVYKQFKANVVKHLSTVGLSREEALRQFLKHFIAYPEKLFIHFQRS